MDFMYMLPNITSLHLAIACFVLVAYIPRVTRGPCPRYKRVNVENSNCSNARKDRYFIVELRGSEYFGLCVC